MLQRGYLTNPDSTGGADDPCGYCQYRNGTEFLTTLNLTPGQKWRDLGIFIVFVCSNWALVYFFIYTVRVRGWTFGLGWVFGGLSKVGDKIWELVRSRGKKTEREEER